jgi:hypothetical protein
VSNFVTFKVQILFYFDCSKLIKVNWEPPATPANTAQHDHVAALMHVAWQKEASSAHRSSLAGLPRRCMWRSKVGPCRTSWAGTGKRVTYANKIPVVLF